MIENPVVHVMLTVPDMSGAHSVRTIAEALAPFPGIADLTFDLPGKTVQVAYDPTRVTMDAMRGVLADEDYPIASASAA